MYTYMYICAYMSRLIMIIMLNIIHASLSLSLYIYIYVFAYIYIYIHTYIYIQAAMVWAAGFFAPPDRPPALPGADARKPRLFMWHGREGE